MGASSLPQLGERLREDLDLRGLADEGVPHHLAASEAMTQTPRHDAMTYQLRLQELDDLPNEGGHHLRSKPLDSIDSNSRV